MTENNYLIRPIQPADNPKIAAAIRSVLIEVGVPKVGTAYADKALDEMYETFSKTTSKYFVVECDGEIFGGAGLAKLDNYDGPICELQKMYFKPEARGKGLGSKLMEMCLEQAKILGYEQCYIETMPYMENARKLYRKFGFHYIDEQMGDTGHYSCTVWMLKNL